MCDVQQLLPDQPVLLAEAEVHALARKHLGKDAAPRFLQRARAEVLANGSLCDIHGLEDGLTLRADCAGGGGAVYSLRVVLDDTLTLECSCPSGAREGLCKHLLALLLYRADELDKQTEAVLRDLQHKQQQYQAHAAASAAQPTADGGPSAAAPLATPSPAIAEQPDAAAVRQQQGGGGGGAVVPVPLSSMPLSTQPPAAAATPAAAAGSAAAKKRKLPSSLMKPQPAVKTDESTDKPGIKRSASVAAGKPPAASKKPPVVKMEESANKPGIKCSASVAAGKPLAASKKPHIVKTEESADKLGIKRSASVAAGKPPAASPKPRVAAAAVAAGPCGAAVVPRPLGATQQEEEDDAPNANFPMVKKMRRMSMMGVSEEDLMRQSRGLCGIKQQSQEQGEGEEDEQGLGLAAAGSAPSAAVPSSTTNKLRDAAAAAAMAAAARASPRCGPAPSGEVRPGRADLVKVEATQVLEEDEMLPPLLAGLPRGMPAAVLRDRLAQSAAAPEEARGQELPNPSLLQRSGAAPHGSSTLSLEAAPALKLAQGAAAAMPHPCTTAAAAVRPAQESTGTVPPPTAAAQDGQGGAVAALGQQPSQPMPLLAKPQAGASGGFSLLNAMLGAGVGEEADTLAPPLGPVPSVALASTSTTTGTATAAPPAAANAERQGSGLPASAAVPQVKPKTMQVPIEGPGTTPPAASAAPSAINSLLSELLMPENSYQNASMQLPTPAISTATVSVHVPPARSAAGASGICAETEAAAPTATVAQAGDTPSLLAAMLGSSGAGMSGQAAPAAMDSWVAQRPRGSLRERVAALRKQ